MPKLTLSEARKAIGWTLTRLATEAGTSVSVIHDLENGRNKNPGYQLVMRIVSALKRGGLAGIAAEDIFPIHGLPKGRAVA